MNQTTSNEIAVNNELPLLVQISIFLLNINNNYLAPYALPVFIVIAIINNILVLLLLIKNVGVSKSLRLYYLVIAIQDLFIVFSSHMWDFIGMVLRIISSLILYLVSSLHILLVQSSLQRFYLETKQLGI